MATPKYTRRPKPLARGARSKVSRAARLRNKGLVADRGGLYSKRTGLPVQSRSASRPQTQGFDPLRVPGDIIKNVFSALAPQDMLINKVGNRIKSATSKGR